MKCPSCRRDNREDAKFCLECGKKLEQLCPQCGRDVPLTGKFCDNCGSPLHTTEEARERSAEEKPRSGYLPRKTAESERKLATILFADVANYTGISEKLDPEDVHQMMEESFKEITDEINRYEGTIMQYMGDGLMAVFGAPLADEEHAQKACHAALAVQRIMGTFSKKIRRVFGLDFLIRVGINSGLVIVGPVGDDPSMDYSAVGDATNVASRMQSMAEPGSILISGNTYKIVKDFFIFEPMGPVRVKGKEKPVEAFKLIGTGNIETRLQAAAMKGLTRFIGRNAEIESLQKAFHKACAGSGQVVGIVGEAGIGKSRLLLEFRNALQGTNHTFLEGKCIHFGGAIAYLPILDVLRSYFDIREGQEETAIKARMESVTGRLDEGLGYILPPLQDILSVTVDDQSYVGLGAKQKREKIFEAIKDLLVRESRERCLVIAIDNLQWIDKTSEAFLGYLIGLLPASPILLILMYRPEYTNPWGNKPCYTGIGLDRLPRASAPELVASLLRATPSTELSSLILDKAGGNPLFVEELTYSLLENGQIEKVNRDEFVLSKMVSEIKVPDTVQGIVAARVDRVPEHLKRTLQIASVIGRDFTTSILARVSGNGDLVRSHLAELQSLEFIYEKSFTRQEEYKFKHDLVHEVVYDSLLIRKRRKIHGAVAKAIESSHPARLDEFLEVLAYHYRKAEDLDNAYQYLKLAGMKATRSFSLWEAFRFYRDAIDVKRLSPQTNENKVEQIAIRLLSASPMISLGFPEESLTILHEGEGLARELGSRKDITSFCSMIGLYYSVKGELLAGMEYGEACFATAEESHDIELMSPIAFDLCSNYAARGEFSKVAALAPKVLRLLEEAGKEPACFDRGYNVYSALFAFHGFSIGYMGNVDEGQRMCEKALEVAHGFQNVYSIGLAELLYGHLIAHQGDGKEAEKHFRKSIGHLEKGQIFVLLGLAWCGLGRACHLMGDPVKALEYMEKGLKLHTEAGANYNSSSLHCFLAAVHQDLGNIRAAQDHLHDAFQLSLKNGETYYHGLSLILLGRLLSASSDETGEAEEKVMEGMKILRAAGVKNDLAAAYLSLAEIYAKKGESGKAHESLATARKIYSETGSVNRLALTDRLSHRLNIARSKG